MKILTSIVAATGLSLLVVMPVQASTAYGTLSNFDTVNDTGETTYGFEIEIEDCSSTDVYRTYNYNHYGVPTITTDKSDPARPVCHIIHASKKDIDGNYVSFTNVPVGSLVATNGHQCTNPSVNEGCEHFGVSYRATGNNKVRYFWLKDDPANPGTLIRSAPVLVNTPVWNYVPRRVVNNVELPAQVVPVIEAPEVEIPPVKEFGEASWVKVIKTTTHNPEPIELDELIGGDKDGDGQPDWANREPPEVETEWYLLQTSKGGGGKQQLEGGVEDLPNGDEIVTRRYEFYKYSGSAWTIDGEQGEAMCDEVAADGLHGAQVSVGVTNANGGSHIADCTVEIIVGEYTGANMVGFDAAADLGLIDAIEDGLLSVAYTDRTLVFGGDTPYNATVSVGALPNGLSVDAVTGVLSGMPTESGVFTFTIEVTDNALDRVSHIYTIYIADPDLPAIGPVISSHAVPDGIEGALYYTTLTATAGALPYSWEVDVLPVGLSLSESGIISGTPVFGSAGVTRAAVTVTDANGVQDTKLLSLSIVGIVAPPAPEPVPAPVITITTETLPEGVALIDYEVALAIAGGVEPYQWSVDVLPAGLSLDKDGVIVGMPEFGSAGTSIPTFSVTDGNGNTGIKSLALVIVGASAPDPAPAPVPNPAPDPSPATIFSWVQAELDAEEGISKVGLMTIDEQEEEFEIDTVDQDEVIANIAARHDATEQEVRDIIVFK